MNSIKWRLRVSILISILLILLFVFQWSIIDRITPFLYLPLSGIIWLGFFVVFGLSLSCFTKYKSIGVKAGIPVTIQMAAFLIIYFVPFTNLWIKSDFWIYNKQREEVVNKVNLGELKPNKDPNSSIIKLGPEYSNISMGGNEILVEGENNKKYVFFFTFRGILDNYSGFIYVPDGGDPRKFSDLNEKESTKLDHLSGNWYYASHH